MVDQGFINNTVYGILMGTVVLFLNEDRLPIPVAHSEDQDEVEVTYFDNKESIEKFLNKK